MAVTLASCANVPYVKYEGLFIVEFANSFSGFPINFSSSITGTGQEQVLMMTNTSNNSVFVFKKVAPSTILVTTWYLHYIDIPGNPIIEVPDSDTPTLTFTNTISDVLLNEPEANGLGDCNGFICSYQVSFNGADNIQIYDFLATLIGCNSSSYESEYFATLETTPSNFFEFEIINEGSTLVLTDLLGVQLIFGDAPLSLEEFTIDKRFSLLTNPVESELEIETSNTFISNHDITYSIISLTGKVIREDILDASEISVDYLESGVYFLKLNSENTQFQALKFIKQ